MKNEFYTCPYCNKEYSNPVDLAHCILSCEEKQRIEEEKAKAKKLAEEREVRKKEIEDKQKEVMELIKKYTMDYGSYCPTPYANSILRFLFEE